MRHTSVRLLRLVAMLVIGLLCLPATTATAGSSYRDLLTSRDAHGFGYSPPHALVGETACGVTTVPANGLQLRTFTRKVGCGTAARLVRDAVTGRPGEPARWWPRQDNRGVWIQRTTASWHHAALPSHRHVRALFLPLGSQTVSVGGGDSGSAQFRPVVTQLTGDGGFTMTHTRWSRWTRHSARGEGTGEQRTYAMTGRRYIRAPVTTKLSRPRERCGLRVFTRYRTVARHHSPLRGKRTQVINRNDIICDK